MYRTARGFGRMKKHVMGAMHLSIPATDRSQIGEVRRCVTKLASERAFDESTCGRAALVATELATNLVRYASQGEILARVVQDSDLAIEMYAVDHGPGISDLGKSLTDGFSTGGTLGAGLGVIQRQCQDFDIYSKVPQGTVIYCRVAQVAKKEFAAEATERSEPPLFQYGVINRPAPVELVSGDTWRAASQNGCLSLMIVDGLGHGPEAAKAAQAAADAFEEAPFGELTANLQRAHERMRGTRGGALAMLQINSHSDELKFVGIGNIAGSIRTDHDATSRGLCSHNGIAGGQFHRVQEFTYPFPPRGLLVVHSDGLLTRWSLDGYPGIASRHPAVIAALLYRDFYRGRDDVTVAVVQRSPAGDPGV